MAAENFVPLVSLQAFKGVDFSDAQPYLDPGQAASASNVNATIVKGALLPERGRIQMATFPLASIGLIFPCVAALYTPLYLVQGLDGSGNLQTFLYNPATGTNQALTGALSCTECIQYGAVVYTNAGQRLFLADTDNNVVTSFFEWQYPPPPQVEIDATLIFPGPTNPPSMQPGFYWYIFTRQTIMPDGSISETSVNLDEFALNASVLQAVHITVANSEFQIIPGGALQFTGTNADGTTFTTNIYRQSTNLAGYFFVANMSTNTTFTDVFSDESIETNAMLEVHRDQPPVGLGEGQLIPNLGNLAIHKSRAWCFVNYADPDEPQIVQAQVWYSNPGRPWEFDNSAQVLLADSDVSVNTNTTVGYQYSEPYGNTPRGMAEVGTILLCFKQREMWAVLGDDQTNFVARTYFGIGCGAQRSITPAVGGCFWLSDSGDVYYFDGSAPQYDSKDIRDFIRPIPGSAGISPADIRAACGAFSNLTFYLMFPTLQKTLGYSTADGAWTSVLPYAPHTAASLAYVLANPNAYGSAATSLNEVVAGRTGSPGIVDWWFVDPNNDLGVPQTFSWQGGVTASKSVPGFQEKQYSYWTLWVPPGTQGSATITLTVDGNALAIPVPDLSVPPRLLQGSLGSQGGTLRGFMASLAIEVTGVAGKPAPQIWSVDVYGQLPADRKLVLRV